MNVFALRSTDPRALYGYYTEGHDFAEENGRLLEARRGCSRIVCAWGTHGDYLGRGDFVRRLLHATCDPASIQCIGLTADGHPVHPLYQRADAQPFTLPVSR